jgi:hypothetical protein
MQTSAISLPCGSSATNNRVTSLRSASRLLRHPLRALQVAGEQPIKADLVLLAEVHGMGGADPLVQQLGELSRRQISFRGQRQNTAPHGIGGMAAVPVKTIGGPSSSAVRNGFLGLFADILVHDASPGALTKATTGVGFCASPDSIRKSVTI